jgi:hypothetical protein
VIVFLFRRCPPSRTRRAAAMLRPVSDGELRDLERRWRASGAVEDEARWHVARVRAGALEPERLALAAWTGWPAAVLAAQDGSQAGSASGWVLRLFGREAPDPQAPLTGFVGLSQWLKAGLRRAPVEAQRRAALAEVARIVELLANLASAVTAPASAGSTAAPAMAQSAALARLRGRARTVVLPRFHAWFPAAHAALRDAAHAAADALVAGARGVFPERLPWLDGPPPGLDELVVAWEPTLHAVVAANHVGRAFGRSEDWWSPYGDTGARKASRGCEASVWAEAVREGQRAALAPWALGLSDPLRERASSALDQVEVASPCPEVWDGMRRVDPAGRVRACDRCQLLVHDISALSRVEAEALLAAHAGQRLCGRFYRRADGRVQTRDCGPAIDALIDQGAPRHELGGTVGIIAGPLETPGS